MPKQRLNPGLLKKLQKATGGKPLTYIREQISKKASRASISSLAAQIVWAQGKRIGVAHALNKAPPEVREEVRSAQRPTPAPARAYRAPRESDRAESRKGKPFTAATIKALLQDQQMRERCRDLVLARKHFDRAFREATTILDDRLKNRSGIKNMSPVNLVGKVLNPDPQKAVIVMSANGDEQEGFHAVCKGVMLAFRNKAHHSLSDKFTREDALKFCGFIDTLLGAIEQAEVHLERV